jgi:spore coat polysaccharide biosynthesis predicted glycosyltransferase SpsG
MKVLILTEGGEKIGFGHITRCIALCEAFEEKCINPEMLVNGESSILGLLKHKNFKIHDWIKNKEKLFQNIAKSDFIVIDSYLAEKSIYDKISEITDGKMLMIDDYNRIDYPKGIILNPSIYVDKLNYLRKSDNTYLLGKDYIILRKEFWDVPEKKISKKVKNVLITFGGANNYDLANKIAHFLKEKFNIKIYIVNAKIKKLTAKEMLNLMLKSDVCISGGGQTTYELARVGVPTIGICFAENQKLDLMAWKSLGFIEDICWDNKDENIIGKIYNSFNSLLSYQKREKLSEIGKSFMDAQGAKNIIKNFLDQNYLETINIIKE